MLITEHIEALLYRYDCVVLPRFGAFLAQRVSAQIHQTTNVFSPPQKTISFNRQLQENDGLLANQIVKSESITYDKALQTIHEFVRNLKEVLETGEQVQIGAVGFFYDQAGKVLFQPSYQKNYLLEAFGTASFTSKEINRATEQEIQVASVKNETDTTLKNIDVIAEEKRLPEKNKEPILAIKQEHRPYKNRPNYWKYAAIGAISIGFSSVLTLGWYSNSVKTHNETAQQNAERQIENEIQQATFIIEEPLPLHTFKINTHKASGNYHIVAGAFREKANAEKRIKQLKELGFEPKYIGINKYGLHQVVYQSFSNRGEALESLRNIRKNNQDAWLLVKAL